MKFTYDDLRNFPADGKRHELIDGEHYVTPSPGTKHQIVSMNLTGALIEFLATIRWAPVRCAARCLFVGARCR